MAPRADYGDCGTQAPSPARGFAKAELALIGLQPSLWMKKSLVWNEPILGRFAPLSDRHLIMTQQRGHGSSNCQLFRFCPCVAHQI